MCSFNSDTLILQPGNVNQGSVLGATHQVVKSVLAGLEAGLCAGRWTQFSQLLAVKRTALQQPHNHSQQGPTQPDAFLCFSMTAEGVNGQKEDEPEMKLNAKAAHYLKSELSKYFSKL